MTTQTLNRILLLCLILASAAITAGGLLVIGYLGDYLPTLVRQPATSVVSAEHIVDPQLLTIGRDYTEQPNDDGTVTRVYTPFNTHYLTDGGTYAEIDLAILPSDSQYDYENTANTALTYFRPASTEGDMVRVAVPDGRSASFHFVDGAAADPVIDANTITYPEMYPGVAAKYTTVPDGVLEELVVPEPLDDYTFHQRVMLEGVYPKPQPDGSITMHDSTTQHMVFMIPAPMMYEQDFVEHASNGLAYEVLQDGDSWMITKKLTDAGRVWLESAEFPIIVDNSYFVTTRPNSLEGELDVLQLSPGDVSYFVEGAQSAGRVVTRTGKRYEHFVIGIDTRFYHHYRSILSFNTSSLPGITSEMITGAKLYVYMYTSSTCFSCGYPDGAGEQPLVDGEDVEVYSGANVWSSLTNPQAIWDAIDPYYSDPGTMRYEGLIDTTGLPNSSTQTCAFGGDAQCLRTIDIHSSSIATTGNTQIGFSQESFSLPDSRDYWRGVYTYTNFVTLSTLWPRLEIIYQPVPEINIYRGYCSGDISRSCYQTSECAGVGSCINTHDRPHEQFISIVDGTTDEAHWELQRSPNGSSSWATVCQVPTGVATNQNCSSGQGTYTCEATKTGTGNTCLVIHNGLTSDTRYYYRARSYRSDPPAGNSPYSSVKDDYTTADAQDNTTLSFSSPSWNTIRVTGGLNYSSGINPFTTNWVIGVFGPWQLAPLSYRFADYPVLTGGVMTSVLREPTGTSPYPQVNYGYWTWADWLLNVFGFSGSNPLDMRGTGSSQVYPDQMFYIGEFARDTRSSNYLHTPSFINGFTYGYTRARTPSAPNCADGSPTNSVCPNTTGNSMRVAQDTTPSDPAGDNPGLQSITNPSTTQYAMQIFEGGEWKYLSRAGGAARNPSATFQWGTYAQWGGSSGVTITGLAAGTCYNFRSQSRNSAQVIGESGSEIWSPADNFCTPLNPPDSPDLLCNYDESRGYHCDLTIHNTQNSPGTYFYRIERSYNGTSGWTTVQNWSSAYQANDTVPFNSLSCASTTDRLYYRVFVAQDGSGGGASVSSPVKNDSLPPCAPATPTLQNIFPTSLRWRIFSGVSEEGVATNQAYDDELNQLYQNISPFLLNWNQTNLLPNSLHSLTTRSCDGGNANNGFVDRCGAWSPKVESIWTYAIIPNLNVACNYASGTDDYYCDVTILETNPPNPEDITKYKLSYCLGSSCELGGTWHELGMEAFELTESGDYFYYKNWSGNREFRLLEENFPHVSCSAEHTIQNYRITVKNGLDAETLPSPNTVYTDTLPPCQPTNLYHNNQTTSGLQWNWTAPSGGAAVTQYVLGYNASCGSTPTSTTTPDVYYNHSGGANQQCNITVTPRDAQNRTGRRLGPGYAYTSIESVAGITFSEVARDQMTVTATSATDSFSNLTEGSSGIQFRNNPSVIGGGGQSGFTNYVQTTSATDSGLSYNHEYCYQARSRNGDGDANTYQPGVGVACRYTYAGTPAAPIIVRADDGTSASVAIRDTDTNPKGGSVPDTQYALCMTKYHADGSVEFQRYVRFNGSISTVACQDNAGVSPDTSGDWGTYAQWGGNNGVNIGLDPSLKYDFSFKARNGDAIENSPSAGPNDNTGCIAGQTCVGTGFGPTASLFLVRNNIVGWAWSSNLGWISTNCLNLYTLTGYGFSCGVGQDWGVNTFFEDIRDINPLSGYAWASSGRTIPDKRWSDVTQLNSHNPAQTNAYDSADKNIVIDSFNRAHRVWAEAWPNNGDTKDIFYQRWNGREWVTAGGSSGVDNVSETVADSTEPTLTFDTNGNPHLAWIEAGDVWQLRWNPQENNGFGAWVSQTGTVYQPGTTDSVAARINISAVVNTDSVVSGNDASPSLAVDTADKPHLVFTHALGAGDFDVYYAAWNGTNWTRADASTIGFDDVSVTTSGDPAPSLSLEQGTGYPHIVWAGSGNVIVYRYWDGAGWTAEQTIQSDATNSPASPVIIMDSSNQPHVVFGEADGARYEWLDVYNTCSLGASTWVTADCQPAQNSSVNFNVNIGQTQFAVDMQLDRRDNPHIVGRIWAGDDSAQMINYRWWDPSANSGTGGWVTVSGDTGTTDMQVSSQQGDDLRGVALSIEDNGDPHIIWGLQETDGTWNVYTRQWMSGYGQSGAGWISFNTNVCTNDTQRGCADNFDCDGAACVESAGIPPADSNGQQGYGYCYDQAGPSGQRYGFCSDNGTSCLEDADCNTGESCVYYTCARDTDCPEYVPTDADEQCKAISTASFSGITREVAGWARILSLKEAGEARGFDDWGWTRLGGSYDDNVSRSGHYTLSGTEIDPQQFLGLPDFDRSAVQLYTLFGWGWQGALIPAERSNSLWLPHAQVTSTGQAATDGADQYRGSPSLVTDSIGDPHIAWTEYNELNSSYDIYYARQKAGRWESAAGAEFISGTTDPIATQVNVSNVDGVDAFWPSLALSSGDVPYIAWQQGGDDLNDGEVYFSRWDSAANTWIVPAKVDDGGTPDLELDAGSNPHVVYRNGPANNSAIQYRWLNLGAWTDVDGGVDDAVLISERGGGVNHAFPKLELDSSGVPHVAWIDGGNVYYRYWDGSDWVTASGDPGSADISVSSGIGGILSISENPQDPDLALYSDGRPGIVWRDPGYVLYRRWNGSDWVTVSGDTDATNLWINAPGGGELERFADLGKAPQVVMDVYDQPHIAWADDMMINGGADVRYRHWDADTNGGSGAWTTASGGYGSDGGPGNYDDPNLTVASTPTDYSSSATLTLDQFNNPQVAWNERTYSATVCTTDADCHAAHPRCFESQAAPGTSYCTASNIRYTKFMAGNTPTGIGWVEFYPAGALLGIPFIETQYGDIYGGDTIRLAPPPAGSNQYTGTYLILSNGDIQGIAGNYASSQTGAPTSSLLEPGLDPLVPNFGLPFGPNALSKINIDALITTTNGVNRYGHAVIPITNSDLSADPELGTSPVLNGAVYTHTGNASIDQDMLVTKGDSGSNTTGNGLIVIDGDLTINANIAYDPTILNDISEMPSVAFIVRGNIFINSLVYSLGGVFVAIDADPNDSMDSGVISTGRAEPITQVITAASDDTTVGSDGSVSDPTADMRFGIGLSGTTYRTLLRWVLDVPAGAEIRNAYIRSHTTGSGPIGNEFEGRIYLLDDPAGIDFSNASAYTASISNSVVYDTTDWNSETTHMSPDIKSLLQRAVSDERYSRGDYFGVMLHEGDAGAEDYTWLDAATGGTAAELVIEYSPRRTMYAINDTDDDVQAWGSGAGDWDANPACLNVGWTNNNPYRSFFRFTPAVGSSEIPDNAEIIGAYLRVYTAECNPDTLSFQLRQGLIDQADIPAGFGGNNPFDAMMAQSVSEIAEDLPLGGVPQGTLQRLADSSRLVQAWVDMTGYTPGNSIGIRLRRGVNETFTADGESRAFEQLNAEYHIDYQVPLHVSGLFIASGFNFDRKYTLNLEGAERIVYDGRVVANTPPGLTDFTKALPIYQRVTP